MKPFEIFRAGTHTPTSGEAITFAAADLDAIVSGYDPDKHHAPIVVGHPKQDAPAYGWVDGLAVQGDRLVATPADIDTAFAELVRGRKFRKVSAAFYAPGSANNPTPGAYYLRHVGFLGAAAPAVKGLKPVEFAEDDEIVVVEFADTSWREAWSIEAIVRLFRGLRDHFIETADKETADRLLPDWEITQLQQAAADLRAEGSKAAASFSDPATHQKDNDMDKTAAAALDERERKVADREKALADQEAQRRKTADANFVDGIVKAGRLPVGLQATATALFADLGEEEITFADGDEQKKTTPRAAFRDLLEKLPVPVATGELAAGEGPDFSDPLQVAAAIAAEIKSAGDRGETLSPADAANRLQAGRRA